MHKTGESDRTVETNTIGSGHKEQMRAYWSGCATESGGESQATMQCLDAFHGSLVQGCQIGASGQQSGEFVSECVDAFPMLTEEKKIDAG